MKKKVAKPPQLAQTGWCGQEFLDHTTPSAPLKEASLLLLCVAATPPPAGPVAQPVFDGRESRFCGQTVSSHD